MTKIERSEVQITGLADCPFDCKSAVLRQLRRGVACVVAVLLLTCVNRVANAQPLDFSDPVKLATVALGDEQGAVAVGVVRAGVLQTAFLKRTGKNAAVVTAVDGSTGSVPAAMDGEQLFEIGSITKVFTGLLLAQAVEKGDLALDDSLGKLLAGTVNFQSSATAAVTLRQLITHSSCLPRLPAGLVASMDAANPYASYTRADLWQDLSRLQLTSLAPCAASYSNFGVGLVGELLARRYNTSWADLVSERITQPLGMIDTVQVLGSKASRLAQGYNNRAQVSGWDFQAMAGAGALRSTVSDMLIFSRAMMAGAAGPLGPAGQRMLTPMGRFGFLQIGYAVFIHGPADQRSYSHNGLTGGYSAQWTISPSAQESVVALASNAHAPVGTMQNRLMAGIYPPPAQPANAGVEGINDYGGFYRIDKNFRVAFVVQDAQLYRRITGSGYRALLPAGTDTFVDPGVGVQYVFSRVDGTLASVSYSQGGGSFTAVKTNDVAPTQAVVREDVARQYVGRYLLKRSLGRDIDFDVRQIAGQLTVRSSNWPSQPVFPLPERADRFAYEAPNIEIQFERDSEGAVLALTLHEGGAFRLLKTPD